MTGFVCKRCGDCCGLVPFSKKEYKRIKTIADNMGISFKKTELEGKTVFIPKKLLKKLNGIVDDFMHEEEVDLSGLKCPFLGFENGLAKCAIYDLRPEVCRLFGDNPAHHPCLVCHHDIRWSK